jgi:hypothetical protein
MIETHIHRLYSLGLPPRFRFPWVPMSAANLRGVATVLRQIATQGRLGNPGAARASDVHAWDGAILDHLVDIRFAAAEDQRGLRHE